MRNIDDGPDGLNDRAFDKALGIKMARKRVAAGLSARDPAVMESEKARLDGKIADAAARRLGLTTSERDAYYAAIHAAPHCGPKGEAIPLHDIGMAAVARTGGSK